MLFLDTLKLLEIQDLADQDFDLAKNVCQDECMSVTPFEKLGLKKLTTGRIKHSLNPICSRGGL